MSKRWGYVSSISFKTSDGQWHGPFGKILLLFFILICLFLKDVIQETTMLGPQRKERATRFLISREDLAMHWTSSLFAGTTAVSLVNPKTFREHLLLSDPKDL